MLTEIACKAATCPDDRLRVRLPEVLAGIERRRDGYNPNPKFDDPLKVLMWFANDPEAVASRQRIRAAKPYCLTFIAGHRWP